MRASSSILRITLAFALVALLAQPGLAITFDFSFGTNGKFMTTFSDTGSPSSAGAEVFFQPSGRILVVGSHSQQGTSSRTSGIAIAALTLNGGLVPDYGTAGKVLAWSPIISISRTNSVMLADGSMLLFHQHSGSSESRPAISKYSPGGIFDPTYNPDLDLFPNQTLAVRIAQAGGGKILALVRNGDNHYLVRLNPDSSRDTTFGPNGVRPFNLKRFATQPRVFGLEELPDGKIIVAGTHYLGFDTPTFVARFDRDTNLDRSFGLQGAVRVTFQYASAQGVTLKVQPDGKVLVGGAYTFLGSTTLLFRLTTRGKLDTTFGEAGFARTAFNNWNVIRGIELAPDGTLFVTGGCGAKAAPPNERLFVIRYSSAGTLVESIVTNFISGREAGSNDILFQPDGRLVVAGFTQNPGDNNLQFGIARFNQ